jgi:hypothetical protein
VVSACLGRYLTNYFFKSQIPWGLPGGDLIAVGFDSYIKPSVGQRRSLIAVEICHPFLLSRVATLSCCRELQLFQTVKFGLQKVWPEILAEFLSAHFQENPTKSAYF